MSVRVDVLLVSCLFLTVHSHSGVISPPQNLSLTWFNDFESSLSWDPTQLSVTGCKYEVFRNTRKKNSEETDTILSPPWKSYVTMEGGFMHFSVKTICNESISKEAYFNVSYPEPVKNFICYLHASNQCHCSWDPVAHVPDLRFYYLLVNEDENYSDSPSTSTECQSYTYFMDTKTGCNLVANCSHKVIISFNGTVNNTFFRNTFTKWLCEDVRPPPLKWSVSKADDKFNIIWTPTDIGYLSRWTFKIRYTECGEEKIITTKNTLSADLNLVPHCPYCMTIKAEMDGGETPWSDEKCFGAETDPNALLYAAIIIPLMFSFLALLTVMCCRKKKENIFPKVPQPRDLLSDIYDNNKIIVRNLYIPEPEDENCEITLVLDPQMNKPGL